MTDGAHSTASIYGGVEHLARYFEEQHIAGLGPGLAVLFTDRHGVIGRFNRGVADVRTGRPVEQDTCFQIGSLSKTLTAAAALRLADRGRLDLHAPITDVLGWFEVPGGADAITPHHLLTHTSGLVFLIDTVPPSRLAVWRLRDTELLFEPGTRFSYSNMGYLVLGYALAQIVGGSYEDAIRELVFEPLGMNESVGRLPEDPAPPMAAGHFKMSDARDGWAQFNGAELTGGHAGIGCTSSDLARFLRMLLDDGQLDGDRFLSRESLELMTTGEQDPGWPGYRYGYGLFSGVIDQMAGHRIVHNAGENPGFESALIGDLDTGLGVVALVNSWSIPWKAAAHALAVLQAAALGKPTPDPPEPGGVGDAETPPLGDDPPADLAPYVGRFRAHAPLLKEHVVFARSGNLVVWRPGFGEVPLVPFGDHVFGVGSAEGSERLTFTCFVDGRAQQSDLGGGSYARMDRP